MHETFVSHESDSLLIESQSGMKGVSSSKLGYHRIHYRPNDVMGHPPVIPTRYYLPSLITVKAGASTPLLHKRVEETYQLKRTL